MPVVTVRSEVLRRQRALERRVKGLRLVRRQLRARRAAIEAALAIEPTSMLREALAHVLMKWATAQAEARRVRRSLRELMRVKGGE